jgi:TonB family protein
MAAAAIFMLGSCGDDGTREVKDLKAQVQRAYGSKNYTEALSLSQKGLTLAREVMGTTAPDTLYFVQAVSEANLSMRNARGAIPALKQELDMRSAAGQNEQKLQPRRTLLIQIAEENGDKTTAIDQAIKVSKGIGMSPGMEPQPVYRTPFYYPADLYRQKVEGDVEIGFGLDGTGAVTQARVLRATPAQVFDQAALETFRKWRFTPMLDARGRPVSASGFTFLVPYRIGR